jgi:hypothetical protein
MASQSVACLAGGRPVGPELMAEGYARHSSPVCTHATASRIDDVHLPFGGEAVTRYGHPLPPATRRGYRGRPRRSSFVAAPSRRLEGVKGRRRPRPAAWRASTCGGAPTSS